MDTKLMTDTVNTQPELTQREIERLVDRGGRFLRAVGTRPAIMRDLMPVGYSLEEHHTGWMLFLELCGYDLVAPAAAARSGAQLAMDELDAWDGPAFARSSAALGRLFPAQQSYLFAGLEARTGIGAVAGCKTYLDRVATLRDGTDPARAHSREKDKAAMELLEQRGVISAAIEERLRGLIAQAMQFTEAPSDDAREPEVQVVAQQFKAWLDDWRATAAVTISRRDHLISLGLASRRASSTEPDPVEESTPAAAAPAAAAPAAAAPAAVPPAQPAAASPAPCGQPATLDLAPCGHPTAPSPAQPA